MRGRLFEFVFWRGGGQEGSVKHWSGQYFPRINRCMIFFLVYPLQYFFKTPIKSGTALTREF